MAANTLHLVPATDEEAANDPNVIPYFAVEQIQTWIQKKELVTLWLQKAENGTPKMYSGRIVQYKDNWFVLATYHATAPRKIRVINRDYVTMIEPV